MSRIEQIREMLAAEPEDVFLNFSLAMEYAKAGRHEEAVDQFARVAELEPSYIAAYSQRSNALITLGRRADARTALAEGIAAAQETGDTHAADDMRDRLSLLE